MASGAIDVTALSTVELQSLVQQLHHQLEEKDKRIAELKRQLGQQQGVLSREETDIPAEEADSTSEDETAPGSREDLFAQLDKMYQDR